MPHSVMQTCTWFDCDQHCQESATQCIVTDATLLAYNGRLFCDKHAKMIMQELAQSPLTVSALAHRIDNA